MVLAQNLIRLNIWQTELFYLATVGLIV